jgi:hypothetical protein
LEVWRGSHIVSRLNNRHRSLPEIDFIQLFPESVAILEGELAHHLAVMLLNPEMASKHAMILLFSSPADLALQGR